MTSAPPPTDPEIRAVGQAAVSLLRDVEAGRVAPADLDAQLEAECRRLVGGVVGEGDPLWPLQVDVARGVLATGGVPADELAEWLAVARRREGQVEPAPIAQAQPIVEMPPVPVVSLPSSTETAEEAAPEPEVPPTPTGPQEIGQTTSAQRRFKVEPGGYAPPGATNPALSRLISDRRRPVTQIRTDSDILGEQR